MKMMKILKIEKIILNIVIEKTINFREKKRKRKFKFRENNFSNGGKFSEIK